MKEQKDNVEIKNLLQKLINTREEIYKGNEEVIEEILKKVREV